MQPFQGLTASGVNLPQLAQPMQLPQPIRIVRGQTTQPQISQVQVSQAPQVSQAQAYIPHQLPQIDVPAVPLIRNRFLTIPTTPDTNIRIWTWNVNSIRNKLALVHQCLIKHNIDLLVVTETKITSNLESELSIPGYTIIWNSNRRTSHHGVAIIYKPHLNVQLIGNLLPSTHTITAVPLTTPNSDIINATPVSDRINDDILARESEGRILSVLLTTKDTTAAIVGTYVPNSGMNRDRPLRRLAYRVLDWDSDLQSYLLQLQAQHSNVIWTGDLNVAVADNDFPSWCQLVTGTTYEERVNLQSFLQSYHWLDTWSILNPTKTDLKHRATYGVGSRCELRLDYVICTDSLKDRLIDSSVDQLQPGSDHVPMGTTFRL